MRKHTTKRTRQQSAKPTKGTETHPNRSGERTSRFDHPLTSQQRVVKDYPSPILLSPAMRFLRGIEVREFRRVHHLSAAELARRVHFSRSYVKGIESGALRASVKFVTAFDELKTTLGERAPAPRVIAALFHHTPGEDVQEIEILAAPVRCVCGKWFVPITPTQRTHTAPHCQRRARAAARHRAQRKTTRRRKSRS